MTDDTNAKHAHAEVTADEFADAVIASWVANGVIKDLGNGLYAIPDPDLDDDYDDEDEDDDR